jgi:hypothetical protein
MDYDQTEGMGGLSVSSYDSIEDERSSLDLRGYPYHGMLKHVSFVIVARHCSSCAIGVVRCETHRKTPRRKLQNRPASVEKSRFCFAISKSHSSVSSG